jgi:hypothetical protein
MKNLTNPLILGLSLFFLVGCGGSMYEDAVSSSAHSFYDDGKDYAESEALEQGTEEYNRQSSSNIPGLTSSSRSGGQFGGLNPNAVKVPEKIVKDAFIGFQVEQYTVAMEKIRTLITKHESYIASEDQDNNTYRINNTLVIRVPNAQFESLVKGVSTLAYRLDYNRVNARDVTAEFVDVQARIKAKKEVEARYYEILQSAHTVNEVLEVEDKIRVIREELEAAQGRLKLLSDQVSYSTVTLNLYEQLDQAQVSEAGFWSEMGDGLGRGWEGFLFLFIGLAHIWPILLIIIIGLFILRRYLKKLATRRAEQRPPSFQQAQQ